MSYASFTVINYAPSHGWKLAIMKKNSYGHQLILSPNTHGVSFTEKKLTECEMTAHLPIESILRIDPYFPVYLPLYLDGVKLNCTQEQVAKFYGKKN
jgi:hypothetical protein